MDQSLCEHDRPPESCSDCYRRNSAHRTAAVLVGMRWEKRDGGAERVFSESNPRVSARTAEARWLEEALDAFAVQWVRHLAGAPETPAEGCSGEVAVLPPGQIVLLMSIAIEAAKDRDPVRAPELFRLLATYEKFLEEHCPESREGN